MPFHLKAIEVTCYPPKGFLKAVPRQKVLIVHSLGKVVVIFPLPKHILWAVCLCLPHGFREHGVDFPLVPLVERRRLAVIDKFRNAPRNTPMREYLGKYPFLVRIVVSTPYHKVANRLCQRACGVPFEFPHIRKCQFHRLASVPFQALSDRHAVGDI